jgi:hypothetical protein
VVSFCPAPQPPPPARLRARDAEPGAVSDARLAQWPALRDAFREPTEFPDAVAIDTTASADDATEQAMDALRR